MVGAWAAGRLDAELAAVRPHDRHWWRRLHLKLREFEADRLGRYLEAALRLDLAGAVAGTGEFAQQKWKAAHGGLRDLFDTLFPWRARAAAAPADVDGLAALWEGHFGRRGDPAVEAKVAATAAALAAAARGRR